MWEFSSQKIKMGFENSNDSFRRDFRVKNEKERPKTIPAIEFWIKDFWYEKIFWKKFRVKNDRSTDKIIFFLFGKVKKIIKVNSSCWPNPWFRLCQSDLGYMKIDQVLKLLR